MRIVEYFKEKRYLILTIVVSLVFGLGVLWASDENINSSILYVIEGVAVFFIIFFIIDFFVTNLRVKKMKLYIENGALHDVEFDYPMDALYAKKFSKTAKDYNIFRSKIATQHSQEIDFITKWVHDVKVPISAIYLLLENVDDEIAQQVEMQTSYIEQNTQKILYHIKSKSLHDDYKIETVKLKDIINLVLKQYSAFFSYKKISLKLEIEDYSILTDSRWSGYIISQLLSNAIKYTEDYGEIKISTYKMKNKVCFSLRNTGQGIEQKELKRIFKKGYSSVKKRFGYASTGYGLYLSKKLADKMGHELYANSKIGVYAEFTLIFSYDNENYSITKM